MGIVIKTDSVMTRVVFVAANARGRMVIRGIMEAKLSCDRGYELPSALY